jgi:hypothetical protein
MIYETQIKNNNSRIDLILSIILYIISTRTSVISLSNIFSLLIMLVLFFVYFDIKRYSLDKGFFKLLFFYIALIFLYTIFFQSFNPMFSLTLIEAGISAYLVLKMVGMRFFIYFVRITYVLALISLPLFLIQQFFYGELNAINSLIESIIPSWEFGGALDSNSFIYTMKENAPDRNSGFMWEPGAFAAYLSLAIYFHVITTNFKLDRVLIVLTLALLTTFSSMGYIALSALIILYVIRKHSNHIVLFVPVLVIALIFIFKLDFMTSKLETEYNNVEHVTDNAFSSNVINNERVSLGRMASLQLDFQDFLKYPIIGIGGEHEARTKSNYVLLNRTNGWGFFIVTFGSLGIFLFFFNLNRSFKLITANYNEKYHWAGIIVILILSFSNHLLTQPVFIGLQIFHFIKNDK